MMNGQTPGKRLLGLRVLTVDGQPINAMQAILRNLVRGADALPALGGIVPCYLVGLITASANDRYQRLGDLVAGTMVVVEERSWLTGVIRLEDPRAAQLAAYIPRSFRVSQSLARSLAAYVERRSYLSPARRREIASHLAEPLLRKFGLSGDTSYDLLLCSLYYRTFVTDRLTEEERPRTTKPAAPVPPPPPPSLGGTPDFTWLSASPPR